MAEDDDKDLEIVEDHTARLNLQVWDEGLSPEQAEAEYMAKKRYQRYLDLRANILGCRRSGCVEFWSKRQTKIPISLVNGTNQIVRVSQVSSKPNQVTTTLGPAPRLAASRPIVRTTAPAAPLIPTVVPRALVTAPRVPSLTVRPATANATQGNSNIMFDPKSGMFVMPASGSQGGTVRTPFTKPVTNVPVGQNAAAKAPNVPGSLPATTPQRPVVKLLPKPNSPALTSPMPTASTNVTTPGLPSTMRAGQVSVNPVTSTTNVAKSPVVAAPSQILQPKPTNGQAKAPAENTTKVLNNVGSATKNISDTNNNSRTYPSLVVTVKPCLQMQLPKQELTMARMHLDNLVKTALMNNPAKFTEWLMTKGLLKMEQKCYTHKGSNGLSTPMKLAMLSETEEIISGGYIWIANCCAKRLSVYDGSIFDPSNQPPMTILKLIYHWACQTMATNVMTWCKVSGGYLKNFYTLLRSVCVASMHELFPPLGGSGKNVELGLITIGSSSNAAQPNKRPFQVEILGAYDPDKQLIRMKVINPSSVSSTGETIPPRREQIITSLKAWVDCASNILIDTSIEQSWLDGAGFQHISRCKAPNEEGYDGTAPTNLRVMNYLKNVVPSMFQSTLSILSKSLIQQFLDELSWRERWGKTVRTTFETILEHVKLMTNWEFGPSNSLIGYLNKISLNPFEDWAYSRQNKSCSTVGIDLLPESIRGGLSLSALFAEAQITPAETISSHQPQTQGNAPKRKAEPSIALILQDHFSTQPKNVALERYYYGHEAACLDDTSGTFNPVKCPLCSKSLTSNTDVYRHITSHCSTSGNRVDSNYCPYCLKELSPNALQGHIEEVHKNRKPNTCRICLEQFSTEMTFVVHMWENHNQGDTPYDCKLCGYKTSFHYQAVDHFNDVHSGKDSVLCPLCMEVLPAGSSANLSEIAVHIQTHQQRRGRKCPSCCLMFYGATECQVHVSKSHVCPKSSASRGVFTPYELKNEPTTLMAKPPPTSKTYMQLLNASQNKKRKTNLESFEKASTTTVRTIAEDGCSLLGFRVVLNGASGISCLECSKELESVDHYPGFMKCISEACSFATCCKQAMKVHHSEFHEKGGTTKMAASIKVGRTKLMTSPLLCACGFQSLNPNRLAHHLGKCSKITAFPSSASTSHEKRQEASPTTTDNSTDLSKISADTGEGSPTM